MNNKITPTPWESCDRVISTVVYDEPCKTVNEAYGAAIETIVAVCFGNSCMEANRDFIVKACNSHDTLVGALKDALDICRTYRHQRIIGVLEQALKCVDELPGRD